MRSASLPSRAAAALTLLAALSTVSAAAQTSDAAAAQTLPLTEQRLRLPLRAADQAGVMHDFALEAVLVRPPGGGPFPLAVITHGTDRDVERRLKVRPDWFLPEARSFARRGWATAIVVRRGFGESTGEFTEGFGTCADPDFVRAETVAAGDLAGAVEALKRQPGIDPARVLGIGQSTGGLAWLAAAARPVPGLVAVLDFAGGTGSAGPNINCSESRLLETFAQFGGRSHVPSLWIFAENDHYFAPDLATRMLAAYRGAGGQAELHVVPPHGADGHDLILDPAGAQIWSPIVDDFLRAHRLPTWTFNPALLAGLAGPHRDHFLRYLTAPSEKSFAIADDGSWDWWIGGQAHVTDAVRGALEKCEDGGKRRCRTIAVNFARSPSP